MIKRNSKEIKDSYQRQYINLYIMNVRTTQNYNGKIY